MASEYFLKKAREQAPPPPPRELTKKEKALNWLHYNGIWIVIGLVLVWILGGILRNALGIGQVRPDVTVAYIGREPLSEETAAALEQALAVFAEDLNGDGRVVVRLSQYATERRGDAETALYYNSAADTALLADLTRGDSLYLLVEDPARVQRTYQIFARDDGSPPDEEDYSAADKVYRWADCPALEELELDQEPLRDLYWGRRCSYDEELTAALEASASFWQRLTEGATR